jgi:predicted lipid-binding transport protein (Tim44 family)
MDALSYVGGIFEAMIGIFCFVLLFSRIFYEMRFAKKYFRTKISKKFTVKNLLEQLSYKGLQKLKC